MARTSGAIGMPTQTGTHALAVGWSAKRKLSGFYGGISPVNSRGVELPQKRCAEGLGAFLDEPRGRRDRAATRSSKMLLLSGMSCLKGLASASNFRPKARCWTESTENRCG